MEWILEKPSRLSPARHPPGGPSGPATGPATGPVSSACGSPPPTPIVDAWDVAFEGVDPGRVGSPKGWKMMKRLWKGYVLSQLFRMEWVNYIQIIPVSPQKNIYPLAMLCKSGKTGRPWNLLTSKARNWPKDHLVLPLDTGDVTSLKFQGPRTSGKHNKNDGNIHHLKNSYVKLPDNFGILWNFMIFHHPAAICNIWENETSWNINHVTDYWIPNPNLRWPSLIIDWIMDSFFSMTGYGSAVTIYRLKEQLAIQNSSNGQLMIGLMSYDLNNKYTIVIYNLINNKINA